MEDTERLITALAVAMGAYLVGSVNLTILTSKLLRIEDLRGTGSGNPGATNLLRTVGWKVASPLLLLDLGKAFATVWTAELLGLEELSPTVVLPLLVGNIFPLFHGFKGGKGIAATVGAFLAIDPVVMLLGGGVFIVAVLISRRVSAGSILMVSSYPCWIRLFDVSSTALITACVVAGIILVTHRANILRLLTGQEPKLGAKEKE